MDGLHDETWDLKMWIRDEAKLRNMNELTIKSHQWKLKRFQASSNERGNALTSNNPIMLPPNVSYPYEASDKEKNQNILCIPRSTSERAAK